MSRDAPSCIAHNESSCTNVLRELTVPPPPIGTKIACKSRLKFAGQCRKISKPIVPCKVWILLTGMYSLYTHCSTGKLVLPCKYSMMLARFKDGAMLFSSTILHFGE